MRAKYISHNIRDYYIEFILQPRIFKREQALLITSPRQQAYARISWANQVWGLPSYKNKYLTLLKKRDGVNKFKCMAFSPLSHILFYQWSILKKMKNKIGYTKKFYDVCKEQSYRFVTFLDKFKFDHNVMGFRNIFRLFRVQYKYLQITYNYTSKLSPSTCWICVVFLQIILDFHISITDLLSVINFSNCTRGIDLLSKKKTKQNQK